MKTGTPTENGCSKTEPGAQNRERVLKNGNGYSKTETGTRQTKTAGDHKLKTGA
jgi:hypothetical protein